MRLLSISVWVLAVLVISGCDFWPKDLEPLAESISERVNGETTAWLVGGDVVVIDVSGSPLFQESENVLETEATRIAEQTIAFVATPLESIMVTFYKNLSEDPDATREFIFLVKDNRPVLQPLLTLDASGPLTREEVDAAIDRLGESIADNQRHCARDRAASLAAAAGDPETLDPASLELLPNSNWQLLDPFGKRIILMQAIVTEALFDCIREQRAQPASQ